MGSSDIDLLLQSLPQLGRGALYTAGIALSSIAFSAAGGLVYGALRTSRLPLLRFALRTYLELFRAVPILVWLFFFFFGLPIFFGLNIPSFQCAVLVLSLWGITEMGEVVRGALQSLPKGQREAGRAIGLSERQLLMYVLLPAAVRRMLPPGINVCTRLIKTTSLTVLIGVTEAIKAGQQIIERTGESLLIYSALFLFYFVLCYPLSALSRRLELRWNPQG
ncbi:amino acid ABC transporter permease [Paenibacillus mucilaginosus]|uniref:Glutamine/glutamate ABC transporter permease n=3 Tax=Paenibacillus mucilaginosus TaxID=61624 RepID=H6NCB5_9BACL|nr:amino acid ABC transporter permease [Paenibacillus mucilaginosus]AEI42053.1 glutamine/glutamate ABC transporter, permease protein [Paenibacillus mucilaginosus KNP414]AFC28308.1 glutamine/glutamate ABC transporter permease [Paenibacillus mucilaginosus 3016]AFH60481.1 glutamine ABC transporter permease [Paenibacillus mucilaginosus K02]MCG7217427.1 amino acid ABC transporter permease [Paenibacillus mucilaginosus]WDM28939.1 amino acid ABC transporter permease [Paenibacillus mucilaginosus]